MREEIAGKNPNKWWVSKTEALAVVLFKAEMQTKSQSKL
jgi:hypothetical protein